MTPSVSSVPPEVVLASSSPYRQQLLKRLGLAFIIEIPAIDESPLCEERAADLAQRLARQKAQAVQTRCPDAIVIGSDQVAECRDRILGKPGSLENAREQLSFSSGEVLRYHTAVCVCLGNDSYEHLDLTLVHMRSLDAVSIERYLATESALDCAGSMKSEGAGIMLAEAIKTDDPSALLGLPLISLCRFLRRCGLTLP